MELPSEMRFPWLVVIFGILLFSLPYTSFLDDPFPPFFKILFTISGAIIFLLGFNQLKLEYDYESELRVLDFAQKKSGYLDYFYGKEYLAQESKDKYIRDIKELVK